MSLAGRPSGLQADHYVDSYFPCESRKPIIITRHLCFLRPRSTIRLSHTTRSVATRTQWNKPMKPSIVFEFLFSRRTETRSELSAKTKRQMVWTAHVYACRKMVEAIMLRRYGAGVLAGTHSTIYSLIISSMPTDSKCYWKTHPKQLGFRAFCNSAPNLWNALPQTVREADSSATFRRRLTSHLYSDWPCLRTHCAP